ncbi:hypothetical protein EI42_02113 [Thermosporothrix hazakensis]|jgi:ribosomal protein S18 acetylase RimI-like enzyme|uniref:N-acetyltransferase domain-containing protein n=1 Tax=Thermosporothrix hazakensis TaxID=644383 RepID=A0A326U8S0_THEHA|nr:hypothetical protein [Thermosporothrix hazakensis]PZW32086.1 hypothetical protein EI42_02113 [Thermosporothrix hazakensis]GCE49586.1 hypothetical protein KTH_44550 [Thermosporothrix hazakensis]
MRIRNFREGDEVALFRIHQEAARIDGTEEMSESEFVMWLDALQPSTNAFVVTDDEDELATWSQAGTLEGFEGEKAGFTVVQLLRDEEGYHFLCQGAVLPRLRGQHGGHLLLRGALNHAQVLAFEFAFEAEQEGIPVYFEALLPSSHPGAERLAAKCEMRPTEAVVPSGMRLYRREL